MMMSRINFFSAADGDEERCPECDMPLEDVEDCYFCDWTRNEKENDES
jgi:hypothetical protein